MTVSSFLSSLFTRPLRPSVTPSVHADEALRAAVATLDVADTIHALKAGANPNLEVSGAPFGTHRTVLQHAVMAESVALARCLLEAGANPVQATAEEWYPPTHRAVLNEQKEMCQLLAHADWTAPASDPLVGETVSAGELVLLRQRAAFAEWFAENVAPLPIPQIGGARRRFRS